MSQEKYGMLEWHTYSEHMIDMMHELMTSKDFADVTFITGDEKTIKAHRNILSACSPVFKNILQMEAQNQQPTIYLRGIQYSEIEAILQFIYLGEAKVCEERINELLMVARDLKIKELHKNVPHEKQKTVDSIADKPLDLSQQVRNSNFVGNKETGSDNFVAGDQPAVEAPQLNNQDLEISGEASQICHEPDAMSFSAPPTEDDDIQDENLQLKQEEENIHNDHDEKQDSNELSHCIQPEKEKFVQNDHCSIISNDTLKGKLDQFTDISVSVSVVIEDDDNTLSTSENVESGDQPTGPAADQEEEMAVDDNAISRLPDIMSLSAPPTEEHLFNTDILEGKLELQLEEEEEITDDSTAFPHRIEHEEEKFALSVQSNLQHEGATYHYCNECPYQSRYKGELVRHVKVKHEGFSFPCDQCEYQATQQTNLLRHIERVHEDVRHSCHFCPYVGNRWALVTHVKSRHMPMKSKHKRGKFACNQCDKSYKSEASLGLHIQYCKGGKFACNQCDKSYLNEGNLRVHIQSFHERVKFPCDQCDKQYTDSSALRYHIRSMHHGITHFCDQCNFQTNRQNSLNRHIQTQHGDANYLCTQCNYRAARKDLLTSHIRSRHEGIRYSCGQCDYTATQQGNLTTHIRLNHSFQ